MAEKKEYRSAVRSRRLIRGAFQELLKEKPLEKITVTDIVNRADINRSTFYAHYTDVKGLVEEIQNEVVERSLALISEVDFQHIFLEPAPFVRGLAEIGTKNVELYRLLSNSDFALNQMEKMKELFLAKAMTAPEIPEKVRQSRTYEIQVNFFIGGIMHTYLQWLLGKLDYSTEAITEEICQLITSTAHIYLNMD